MAGSARYTRYILFAFIAIVFLVFVSSGGNKVPDVGDFRQGAKDFVDKNRQLWTQYSGGKPGSAPPAGSSKDTLNKDTELPVVGGSPGNLGLPLTDTKTAHEPESSKHNTSPNPYSPVKDQSLTTEHSTKASMNATFVTLARNSDIWEIARSIRQVEDRFNKKYGYDWVFLNDADFDETFKKVTTALTSGKARYGKIAPEHWGFPDFIDQEKAKKVREDMAQRKIIYGDSISYRHMCRYESGFFFRHPLMLEYEWYWRVEPSIELYCDIDYDPFVFMAKEKKKYSFVISLYEYQETIETLWESTKKFIRAHPEHIAQDNLMPWLSDDKGETYTNCHFWSNFEIGNLNWLRSDGYIDFFTSLDRDGGFFYERWGDAPVHSIAAGLMLNKSEVHFFNDIAYYHVPFTHCPTGEDLRTKLKCHCNPQENFDWNGYSCTARYYDVMKMEKPAGYEKEQ